MYVAASAQTTERCFQSILIVFWRHRWSVESVSCMGVSLAVVRDMDPKVGSCHGSVVGSAES